MLIISIDSKSYINLENSDDIISEEEAESWRSDSISLINPEKIKVFDLLLNFDHKIFSL